MSERIRMFNEHKFALNRAINILTEHDNTDSDISTLREIKEEVEYRFSAEYNAPSLKIITEYFIVGDYKFVLTTTMGDVLHIEGASHMDEWPDSWDKASVSAVYFKPEAKIVVVALYGHTVNTVPDED